MKIRLTLTISCSILTQIDRLRGREKRSTFVEHLLKLGLKEYVKKLGEERNERIR
ncbi:MAG: hypothetical protein ACE5NN_01005 [Candidatus Bathyarchaeia archaeon]